MPLKVALTDEINSHKVYMKVIDHSYYYKRYTPFNTGTAENQPKKFELVQKIRKLREEVKA